MRLLEFCAIWFSSGTCDDRCFLLDCNLVAIVANFEKVLRKQKKILHFADKGDTMREERVIAIIKTYGSIFGAKDDITTSEARAIIRTSKTRMEIVGNSYLYGYIKGSQNEIGNTKQIPLYNIRQMSDEKWNSLAGRNKEERAEMA